MRTTAVAAALLATQGLAWSDVNSDRNCRLVSRKKADPSDNECWLQWSGWSACQGLCGQGVKTATRRCRGIPGITNGCLNGKEQRRRKCSDSQIIGSQNSCPYWSFWSEWSPYPGCNVMPNPDWCIHNRLGSRQRTRDCQDARASLNGEQTNCVGLDSPNVAWVRDAPVDSQSCTSTDSLPPTPPAGTVIYEDGPWSPCIGADRTNQYCGTETMVRTHVCANTMGTWVDSSLFTEIKKRTCCQPQCNELAIKEEVFSHEAYPDCYSRLKVVTRTFESFNGGCEQHMEFSSMQVLTSTVYSSNLLTFTITTESQIDPFVPVNPELTAGEWGVCQPRTPSWAPNSPATICHMNGIQTRKLEYKCTHTCNGQADCLWAQEPTFVQFQERICGNPAVDVRRNDCYENRCNPTCTMVGVCDSIDVPMLTRVIGCENNECMIPEGAWKPAPPCGCGDIVKNDIWIHECDAESQRPHQCPQLTQNKFKTQYEEAEQTTIAVRDGRCICKADAKYHDFRYEMTQTFAENGEMCSTEKQISDYKVSEHAQEQCLGSPKCDACPIGCLSPGMEQVLYVPSRQLDLCGNTMVTTSQCGCQPLPLCCSWSAFELDIPCGSALCPSTEIPSGRKVSKFIDATGALCPISATVTENVRYQDVPCPQASCPDWPDFGEWTSCSWILSDMTVCGGNRNRTRGYPCRSDVESGRCHPKYYSGYKNDGRINDPYLQYDSHTPEHHSQFCWDLFQDNLERTTIETNWSGWARSTENNGCFSGQIKEVRTRTTTDRCCLSAGRTECTQTFIEERLVKIPACVDDFSSETCDFAGYNELTGAPLQCSATIKWSCVMQDVCGATLTKHRPAEKQELLTVCGLRAVRQHDYEGECRPVETGHRCVGECELTTSYYCPEIFPNTISHPSCPLPAQTIPCEGGFQPVTGGAIVNPRPYPGTIVNAYGQQEAVTVQCNPCGGKLQCIDTTICVNPANPDEVSHDVKEIDCPVAPKPTWGIWSTCLAEKSCWMSPARQSEKICIDTRSEVPASPSVAHCYPLNTESRTNELPACECPEIQQGLGFCRNINDPNANCGMGSQFKTDIHIVYHCQTREILSSQTIESLVLDNNGASIACPLPFQPQPVNKQQWGCDTPRELCTGGQVKLTVCEECPADTIPTPELNMKLPEMCTTTVISDCAPAPVYVRVSEWKLASSECRADGCQATKIERRECKGGVFAVNHQCIDFNVDVCRRDEQYELVDGFEQRIVPCQALCVSSAALLGHHCYTTVDIEDPDCECGVCEIKRCNKHVCTGQIDYNQCTVIQAADGYRMTISDWSECHWATVAGEDKCNTEGHRTRTKTVTCQDNRVVNTISHEMWEPQYSTNVQGVYQYGGALIADGLSRCLLQAHSIVKPGKCDYFDSCFPRRTDLQYRVCEGVETITGQIDTSEQCAVDNTAIQTEWTQCTVDCGLNAGTQTRHKYATCDLLKTPFDVEERACGCAMAYWSEWSEEVGVCDPCGETTQYRVQGRTCIKPSFVTVDQCYGKCNQCIPDADGADTQRRNPYDARICREETKPGVLACPYGTELQSYSSLCSPFPVQSQETWCGVPTNKNTQTGMCGTPKKTQPTTTTECSVVCGQGTRTITTFDECTQKAFPRVETCQGKWGAVVQKDSATGQGSCDALCDGLSRTTYGFQQKNVTTVCELNENWVIETKIVTTRCTQLCSYWGIWSSWSICSSTCGTGQQQRQRVCDGGQPGEGGCTLHQEDDEQGLAFMPTNNGAVHIRACNTGDCCNMNWSGWSNCCSENGLRKRLRFEGENRCTGVWNQEEIQCTGHADWTGADLPTCNEIRQRTTTVETEIIHGRSTINPDGSKTTRVTDTAYGPIDKIYKIGTQQYSLKTVNNVRQWYLLEGGQEFPQVIKTQDYTDATGTIQRFYQIGSTWYEYRNRGFAYAGGVGAPVSTKPVTPVVVYQPKPLPAVTTSHTHESHHVDESITSTTIQAPAYNRYRLPTYVKSSQSSSTSSSSSSVVSSGTKTNPIVVAAHQTSNAVQKTQIVQNQSATNAHAQKVVGNISGNSLFKDVWGQ